MLERPQDWITETHVIRHKPSGVEYWIESRAITEVWNDSSLDRVFSYEQGCQIKEAFDKRSENKATKAQKELMKAFDTTNTEGNGKRPWWKFW